MLTVYTLEQSDKWDAVVRSFAKYDVYWLSGYVKAFQIHGDGEPLLFFYEDENVRGINVVMKRDIADDTHFQEMLPKNVYFDFSSPYGYGGWLIEGDENSRLFVAYEAWCSENGIISEFVRFHPVIENHCFCEDVYTVVGLGHTVVMDISSPEIIWNNLTSKNRNMIRKAQKNGIRIYNGRFPEIYAEFRRIYNSTMDKDSADSYYYFDESFYNSICEDLPEQAQVFYAVQNQQIIAASIMLTSNGKMNYHLSGSLQEYANLAPTNLLLYKAALWGCANGCKTFYLGGGVGSEEDGLFRFKKAFYRLDDMPRFYIGKRIWNQTLYDELMNKREGMPRNEFFPLYRA